jgi:hypothetical protein
MSTLKATPGPWAIAPDRKNDPAASDYLNDTEGFLIEGGSDEADWTIAAVWNDGPPGEANAHLIAAAPDLYEALSEALAALIWASGSSDFAEGGAAHEGFLRLHKPAISQAFSALARARGETSK